MAVDLLAIQRAATQRPRVVEIKEEGSRMIVRDLKLRLAGRTVRLYDEAGAELVSVDAKLIDTVSDSVLGALARSWLTALGGGV